jgi:chloride channel 3/4/5
VAHLLWQISSGLNGLGGKSHGLLGNLQEAKSYGVRLPAIKDNPVFEVFLVILITAALQYPNPATRAPGDIIIKNLLVNCSDTKDTWVCRNEHRDDGRWDYIAWLAYGTLVQLASTTITFGLKVPSGIIIPALVGGALFGRLVGQWVTTISPGIFAMVGAAAFLAGVTRMTISLCVIMFEVKAQTISLIWHHYFSFYHRCSTIMVNFISAYRRT